MSNSSREYSPDWLRNFQAQPTESILTLSSSSESVPDNGAVNEDETDDDQLAIKSVIHKTSEVNSPSEKLNAKGSQAKNTKGKSVSKKEGSGREGKLTKRKTPEKPEPKKSVWTLSSDSEAHTDRSPFREDDVNHKELSEEETCQQSKEDRDDVILDTTVESSLKGVSLQKSPKQRLKVDNAVTTKTKGRTQTKQENDGYMEVAEGEAIEKQTGPYVSSSRLPLVLSEKVQRAKALVECEGDSIDLSGDLGSVGRVVISDSPSGDHDMLLDLKGTIYKTKIVPSRTFCVVSFSQSEAKIEAIMNDFIQMKPQSNVYEAETMVEGTLEGFSFDSEDEADNPTTHQTDENEGTEQQTNGKGRRKNEKTSGEAKKKTNTAAKKPVKKVKKKAPVSKKPKTKK